MHSMSKLLSNKCVCSGYYVIINKYIRGITVNKNNIITTIPYVALYMVYKTGARGLLRGSCTNTFQFRVHRERAKVSTAFVSV